MTWGYTVCILWRKGTMTISGVHKTLFKDKMVAGKNSKGNTQNDTDSTLMIERLVTRKKQEDLDQNKVWGSLSKTVKNPRTTVPSERGPGPCVHWPVLAFPLCSDTARKQPVRIVSSVKTWSWIQESKFLWSFMLLALGHLQGSGLWPKHWLDRHK